MKVKKKIIIPLAILLVAGGGAAYAVTAAAGKPQIQTVDTYMVERTDLANYVSVTGTVESADSTNVYTNLSYPIQSVAVEVGDTVKEGDILCQLDTSALESTIAQNQASLSSAQARANHGVEVAQKGLDTRTFDVENEYDRAIERAEAAVKTAENNLSAQQHRVADLRQTIRDLRDDKLQVPDTSTYEDYIEEQQKALVQAEITMENYQLELEKAETELQNQREQKEIDYSQTEDSAKDSITDAELSANFNDQYIAIQRLQKDLGDATVTAPVSGTVTAVYAKEGVAGGGLLFVIEDTDSLKVTTSIKEYDVGSLEEGLPVTIKADGTGDEEFTGSLSKIFPTTVKNERGQTVDTTNAEFPAEIKVDPGSKLRIGMNARLSIIIEKKDAVMTVPFEAVAADDEGNTYVFIMVSQEDGTNIAKKVNVTPGMETDYASEITSSELKEGDLVITSPDGLEDGMLVAQLDENAMMRAVLA